MVYRRRYRPSVKRVARKKRVIRKYFKRKMKTSKYNKGVWVKCEAQKLFLRTAGWTAGTPGYDARFQVLWGVQTNLNVNQICLSDSPEFLHYRGVYSQYVIKGVKMRYVPDRPQTSDNTLRELKDMHIASIDDPTVTLTLNDATPSNIKQMPDYKMNAGQRSIDKYVSVSKYTKKRNGDYMLPTASDYTNAATFFLINNAGFGVDTSVGTMYVTYYVYFQRPKINL